MKDEAPRKRKTAPGTARAQCACGAVALEIDTPAFWAWHDHTPATRRAHAAAYATYIGVWKSKLRIVKGAKSITRFADKAARTTRAFCAKCCTPVLYERARDKTMINIPRALFETRTGREPRYHIGFEQRPDWAYANEPLVPLKGYPGVLWNRARTKQKPPDDVL